jgi:16S rRNA (guanine1516-N2)-methyltransferase
LIEPWAGRVEARGPGDRPGTGVAVDFASLRFPGGPDAVRGMPLVRACGRDLARRGATLVDATAGLGYDAFVLAMAGFRVIACERSAEVFRLLEDGVRRTPHPKLSVRLGEARDLLRELAPEVIYLDPMYPPKRRASALPPKDMQMVRALVGDDLDAAELFAVARSVADRVVVKRPADARPMATPTASVGGKLARFDVFVGRASG